MRIYVQWATSQPEDWTPVDISSVADVRRLPRKAAPRGGEKLDRKPGWINALNYQGVIFHGYDHVAIEYNPILDTAVITGWQDDPDDFAADQLWATQWTFLPPVPDPAAGGRVNTRQSRVVFGSPEATKNFPPREVRSWEEFVRPPAEVTLHGVWMSNELYTAHMAAQSAHGWREWVR